MKIAIDVSPLSDGNSSRGVGFYTKYLTEGLTQKNDGNEYILVKSKDQISKINPDIIHYPFFDLFFNTLPKHKNIPTIVTVHDVIPLVFPNLFPPGVKGRINLELQKRKLQNVDLVITDSISAKKDIHKYLGTPEHKIEVIYLGCDPSLKAEPDTEKIIKVQMKYGLPDSYILRVGDINKHKNFRVLLDAMTRIHNADLVLVGKALAIDAPKIPELIEIEQMIEQFSLKNKVHRLGFVPSEDMNSLYSGAKLTIQNSLYEGFGLTSLESMTCGTPVIVGDTGSQPEIVGNAGILINPEDVLETTDAIEKILRMDREEYKNLQQKCLQQAKKFSVQKMVDETILAYKKVLVSK